MTLTFCPMPTSGFCRLQTTPFTWSIICPVNTQSRLSPVQTASSPLTQENREPIAIIGFGFHDSQSSEREVTLYVPSKAELNSCNLYSDSGNIQASDLTASVLASDVTMEMSHLRISKAREQLALNLSAGQLNADTLSGKTVTIYNDSGNISLDSCTSDDLHLETDYGDIQLDNAAVKKCIRHDFRLRNPHDQKTVLWAPPESPMIVELFLWLK